MFGYRLEETRLRQVRTNTSAADSHTVALSGAPVPEGKVWIIHSASYYPSAAETQTIAAAKYVPGLGYAGILNPVSLALDNSIGAVATFIEQGMEYFLFPGEYIIWTRAAHTAGSTMICNIQFTEIDLPLYLYDDPQSVRRQERALSSIRQRLGGALGGGRGIVPPTLTGERGGRSGPLEK